MKLYRPGDQVEVYSHSHERWYEDGEVTNVAAEYCMIGNTEVRAGSMRVVYDGKLRIKWVAPQEMDTVLRKSRGPRMPTPVIGPLFQKQDSQWVKMHLILKRGVLRLWSSSQEALSGRKPAVSFGLLYVQSTSAVGVSLQISLGHRCSIPGGSRYVFQTASEGEAKALEQALLAHARYCKELTGLSDASMLPDAPIKGTDRPLALPGVWKKQRSQAGDAASWTAQAYAAQGGA